MAYYFPRQVLRKDKEGSHLFLMPAFLRYHKAPNTVEQRLFLVGTEYPCGGWWGGKVPRDERVRKG